MERIPGDGRRECVCQLPKSRQKGWEVGEGLGSQFWKSQFLAYWPAALGPIAKQWSMMGMCGRASPSLSSSPEAKKENHGG